MIDQNKDKSLYEDMNTSDVFNRAVIAGLLKILNRELWYTQVWDESEGKTEKITVPFFYDFGGGNPNSERFIQDNYTFFGSDMCTEIGIKKIDGNFDIYPQGRISLSNVTIESSSTTNNFVLGKYNKKKNGRYQTYVSFLFSIPLNFPFNIEIKAETLNTAFKIDQAFREFFYRSKVFYINYRGMKIGCRAGFPDTNSIERSSTYNMGSSESDKYIKLTYSVQVETYQPVFDPTTEMLESNKIRHVASGFKVLDSSANIPIVSGLEFVSDLEGKTLLSGTDVLLEWRIYSDSNDSANVSLSYYDYEDEQEHKIATLSNRNFYDWEIPESMAGIGKIDLIVPNSPELKVIENPDIRLVPDSSSKIISKDSMIVKSKGLFAGRSDVAKGCFSYVEDKTGKLIEIPVVLNLKNNMIDLDNPADFKCFVYVNDVNPRMIDLIIRDMNSKLESRIRGINII